jgi:hypothetical protein
MTLVFEKPQPPETKGLLAFSQLLSQSYFSESHNLQQIFQVTAQANTPYVLPTGHWLNIPGDESVANWFVVQWYA